MENKVLEFIYKHNLLHAQDRVVAGVSGGADSVCLFLLLLNLKRQLGIDFCVVHVEHGIRGKESASDALFVENLCREHGVDCHIKHYQVPELAESFGMSLEETGRKVRYEAFYEVKKSWGGTCIATAHHKNDQAETILMNLFRGTGLRGLKGMEPLSGDVIRPLLCLTRKEIEDWLGQQEYGYCVDCTNEQDIYTRNRIRHRILPEAEKINAKAVEHLSALAETARICENYIEDTANLVFERHCRWEEKEIFIGDALKEEHELIRKYVLRKALADVRKDGQGLKDLGAVHLDALDELFVCETGKKKDLPSGWYGRKTYGGICIGCIDGTVPECRNRRKEAVEIPGKLILNDGSVFCFQIQEYKKEQTIPQKTYTKWFDYDKINNSLELRMRQAGDYLTVNPEGGRKKLKDYFIDEKVDRTKRDDILLLAEGSHVLWAVGYRTSAYYWVTDATRRVLTVTLEVSDQNIEPRGGNNNE